MKKVSAYIYVRALGTYDFEFYVEDDCTDEEIKKRVNDAYELSMGYTVESGYKKRMVEEYYKEDEYGIY